LSYPCAMKIVVCGNYGAGNIGDEAILYSTLQYLRKTHPSAHIDVLCAMPDVEQKFFSDFSSLSFLWTLPMGIRSFVRSIFKGTLWKTVRAIKKCDLFILGGGGLFADDESIRAPFIWGAHLMTAKFFKRNIKVEAISVGPLKRKIARWFTQKSLQNIQTISVRDRSSNRLLLDLGIKSRVTFDPVFRLSVPTRSPLPLVAERQSLPEKPYIIVSLRPWKSMDENLYKKLAHAFDRIIEKFAFNIVFIPFQETPQNDVHIMNKIIEHVIHRRTIFVHPYSRDFGTLFHLFQDAEMVIGMRLHSIIFSILTETPFCMISYSDKGNALLEMLENYDVRSVPIENPDSLFNDFEMIYKNRQSFKKSLKQIKEYVSTTN